MKISWERKRFILLLRLKDAKVENMGLWFHEMVNLISLVEGLNLDG